MAPRPGRDVHADVLVAGPLQGCAGSDRSPEHGAPSSGTDEQHGNESRTASRGVTANLLDPGIVRKPGRGHRVGELATLDCACSPRRATSCRSSAAGSCSIRRSGVSPRGVSPGRTMHGWRNARASSPSTGYGCSVSRCASTQGSMTSSSGLRSAKRMRSTTGCRGGHGALRPPTG
jgi:hypothetical protein